jgi:cobalt-zinc-cadmium efflux system membrane fusion protein
MRRIRKGTPLADRPLAIRPTSSLHPRIIICLLAIVSGALGCKQSAAAPVTNPPPGEVWVTEKQFSNGNLVIVPAREQDVGTTISMSGRVTFDDLKVSHVFSPVTGRVVTIAAQLGERVQKGAALATIESPDVGLASADLDKARADLVAAEHEYDRQKQLFEAGAEAQKNFEAAQDNFSKAKAENERALQKARLLRAGSIDKVTQNYVLRSLIDGELVARNISPGMEVQGQYSGGTTLELFTIGELDPVWVIADVFEMDLAKVRTGQKVIVKVVSYPDRTFEGVVDWISGTLDPGTRTAKVRCTIANRERLLKPEMYAATSIVVEGKKALAIPKRAVLWLGDQAVVFVYLGKQGEDRERFERRPITVGEGSGEFVPVTRGLEKDETVVVDGALLLSEML